MVHSLASNVGDLLAGDVGEVFELQSGIDQVIQREAAGLVTSLGRAGLRTGYGAAGSQDFNLG